MAQLMVGNAYPGDIVDVGQLDLSIIQDSTVLSSTSTEHKLQVGPGDVVTITGIGLTYGADGRLALGTVTGISEVDGGAQVFSVTGLNALASTLVGQAAADDIPGALATMFSGDDTMIGSPVNFNFLTGLNGNDSVAGSDRFDRLHGNIGNDTVSGGGGIDWVRGGKGNDSLSGGVGNDWLSGDRDNDTMSGGAGADIFNSFGAAGSDRIVDFNLAEGDQVRLEPGSAYTTAQVGADTVITVDGAAQVTLVGVSLSSLTGGWIFTAS
jgi:serralysin